MRETQTLNQKLNKMLAYCCAGKYSSSYSPHTIIDNNKDIFSKLERKQTAVAHGHQALSLPRTLNKMTLQKNQRQQAVTHVHLAATYSNALSG